MRYFYSSLLSLLLVQVAGAQTPVPPPELPAQIRPSSQEVKLVEAHAKGSQIYVCRAEQGAYKWVLKGPDAELFDGKGTPVGRHFAGPTWEWKDHSKIRCKLIASAPSTEADAVPWLLLEIVESNGKGVLESVSSVQRLNTHGGQPPKDGADAAHVGKETRVPYTADYVFWGPAKH